MIDDILNFLDPYWWLIIGVVKAVIIVVGLLSAVPLLVWLAKLVFVFLLPTPNAFPRGKASKRYMKKMECAILHPGNTIGGRKRSILVPKFSLYSEEAAREAWS